MGELLVVLFAGTLQLVVIGAAYALVRRSYPDTGPSHERGE